MSAKRGTLHSHVYLFFALTFGLGGCPHHPTCSLTEGLLTHEQFHQQGLEMAVLH